MAFPCTSCGVCCVVAGQLGLMPAGESGACVYLGEDNLCTIYETRPEVCRIDAMGVKLGLSEQDNYRLTAAMCNRFQEALGVDEEFRVKLD